MQFFFIIIIRFCEVFFLLLFFTQNSIQKVAKLHLLSNRYYISF